MDIFSRFQALQVLSSSQDARPCHSKVGRKTVPWGSWVPI